MSKKVKKKKKLSFLPKRLFPDDSLASPRLSAEEVLIWLTRAARLNHEVFGKTTRHPHR